MTRQSIFDVLAFSGRDLFWSWVLSEPRLAVHVWTRAKLGDGYVVRLPWGACYRVTGGVAKKLEGAEVPQLP